MTKKYTSCDHHEEKIKIKGICGKSSEAVRICEQFSKKKKSRVFTLLTFNLASHTQKIHLILLCLGLSSQSFKQGPVSLLLTNFELPFQKPKIPIKMTVFIMF